jgi:hypothetical protein
MAAKQRMSNTDVPNTFGLPIFKAGVKGHKRIIKQI